MTYSIDSKLGTIILVIFLILLILLLKQIFLKAVLHFKLLKKVYPKELQSVKSYIDMNWFSNMFKLDFPTMIWFWSPFYYDYLNIDENKPEFYKHHIKLKIQNKKILLHIGVYIGYILLISLLFFF